VPDGEGRLHSLVAPESPTVAVDFRGKDVLRRIARSDGWFWESNPMERDSSRVADVRDGIELGANLVVTINADLKVGALQESLTVTGATPTVDVQQAANTQVLSRDQQDALPTAHAINSIATYLGTMGGGKIFFPRGITLIGKTILFPDGVGVQGEGTPASQVKAKSTFNGQFMFESKIDSNTNHQIRDIYLEFLDNSNVGGIYFKKPYDYTEIVNVVGNYCCKQFIKIGNNANTGVSQTVKVDSCLVYTNSSRNMPVLDVQFAQECIYINNKFFGGNSATPVALFDNCSQQTLIGNSFTDCSAYGSLTFSTSFNAYRVSGNHILHNLFENISGQYAIQLIGKGGYQIHDMR
jgi:hypothetical protein